MQKFVVKVNPSYLFLEYKISPGENTKIVKKKVNTK